MLDYTSLNVFVSANVRFVSVLLCSAAHLHLGDLTFEQISIGDESMRVGLTQLLHTMNFTRPLIK